MVVVLTAGELLDIERVTSSSEGDSWKSAREGNSLAAYPTHAGIRAGRGRATALSTATVPLQSVKFRLPDNFVRMTYDKRSPLQWSYNIPPAES